MRDLGYDPVIPTVLAGVLIYVFGQIAQSFLLKPVRDFRVVLVDISHKLKFWANILTNSGVKMEKILAARSDMRDLSSNLESKYIVIPFRQTLSRINAVPSPDDVRDAARQLIFLSNSGGEQGSETKNGEAIAEVKKKLRLTL